MNFLLQFQNENSSKKTMTLLFTIVIIGKQVKIGLRQGNVVLFLVSAKLLHV